jgi:hypothetical protein
MIIKFFGKKKAGGSAGPASGEGDAGKIEFINLVEPLV